VPDEEVGMLANSLSTLGQVLSRQSRPAEAETVLREAVALRKKLVGPAHPQTTELIKLLVAALEQQGRLEEAAVVSREANRGSTGRPGRTPE
jgi:uncharacterized protein HemY